MGRAAVPTVGAGGEGHTGWAPSAARCLSCTLSCLPGLRGVPYLEKLLLPYSPEWSQVQELMKKRKPREVS